MKPHSEFSITINVANHDGTEWQAPMIDHILKGCKSCLRIAITQIMQKDNDIRDMLIGGVLEYIINEAREQAETTITKDGTRVTQVSLSFEDIIKKHRIIRDN